MRLASPIAVGALALLLGGPAASNPALAVERMVSASVHRCAWHLAHGYPPRLRGLRRVEAMSPAGDPAKVWTEDGTVLLLPLDIEEIRGCQLYFSDARGPAGAVDALSGFWRGAFEGLDIGLEMALIVDCTMANGTQILGLWSVEPNRRGQHVGAALFVFPSGYPLVTVIENPGPPTPGDCA